MKVVSLLSGGLDSTVLLYLLRSQGHEVHALSILYGQRHRKEVAAAVRIAANLGIIHRMANLDSLRPLLAGSSQTDDSVSVPEGHYEDASMRATVVPNRNMLLLAVAGAWAVSTGSDAVAYAAHAGDHACYPDCRPEFAEALAAALKLCDYRPLSLLRPFVYPTPKTKADLVKLGMELDVPFELTWSCYVGGDKHCGRCGTCNERKEAFQLAGVDDPTEYE